MPHNSSKSSHFSLIPTTELVEIIPYMGERTEALLKKLQILTKISNDLSANYRVPTVTFTPQRQHISEATSHTGSRLVRNPAFSSIKIRAGEEETTLFFLVREKDLKPGVKNTLLTRIDQTATRGLPITSTVTVTPETREAQPPRRTQPKERQVVGKSAKDIVIDYCAANFPELAIDANSPEIKSLNFNLCHVLSYGLANKAIDEVGGTFNTQVKHNIFSGSRRLNEAAFPIENALLKFITDHKVKEI